MQSRSINNDIESLKSLLKVSDNIIITTHHNPDGDAVGSILGLYFALKQAGVQSKVLTPNGLPDFLSWIPGADSIIKFSVKKEEVKEIVQQADLMFCLDFNGFKRAEEMGNLLVKSKAKKILIDHHPDPDDQFDVLFSDTDRSSTSEIVYSVIELLLGSDKIDHNSAVALFVGIMTDTGSFSYGCSRDSTFNIAGKLIAKGVNVEEVQKLVYHNFSSDRMRLYGYSLNEKMRVFPEHKSAYISLTKNDLKQFRHKNGDTEGFVNAPLSIKGIVFSALFVEYDAFVKVSLRSRGKFPVNLFCNKHFNGGGHTNAAGGRSFMSLKETEELFERLLIQYSNDLNA